MSRFRFSIGSFLGVVTLLALGLAALVSQSTLGASVAYTTFLSLLGDGFRRLTSRLCRQLVTLASDDSRNLRRDDEAHCSGFADMFEKDRVALISRRYVCTT